MKYLIPLSLLLTGCGTFGNPASGLFDIFKGKGNEYTPEQIEAMGNTVSYTGGALSVWVYAGIILVVIGIIMLAFSLSRHAGTIFIAGGVACAFTGHLIEDYAHYTVLALIGAGFMYASYFAGKKLGFEKGKDYMENEQ